MSGLSVAMTDRLSALTERHSTAAKKIIFIIVERFQFNRVLNVLNGREFLFE